MDKDTQVMSERCHAKVSKRWSKVAKKALKIKKLI